MSNKTEIRVPDIGDFDKVPVIEVLVAEGDTIEKEQSLVTLESDKATMEVPSSKAGKLVELKVSEGDEVSEGDVIGIVEVEGDESGEDSESEEAREAEEGKGTGEGESEQDAEDKSDQRGSPETGNRKPETGDSETGNREPESEKSEEVDKSEGDGSDDLPAPPVPFTEMGRDPSSIPHASPAVRKLARELGVELQQVKGSGEHDRITTEDLKQHVKSRLEGGAGLAAGSGLEIAAPPEIDFAKFGEIEAQSLS